MDNEENPDYTPFSNCYFSKKKGSPVGDEEEYKKTFHFEESESLMDELNNFHGVSKELSNNMYSELNMALEGQDNVLIVGTEGTKTITILTTPEEIVGGRGPVLIPTSDSSRIVSMVSKEFVEGMAGMCQDMEDQDEAEVIWQELLTEFFDKTIEKSENGDGKTPSVPDFLPEGEF
jgi:ATPase subunit of ABC transporter with duplicated ATPase domains